VSWRVRFATDHGLALPARLQCRRGWPRSVSS
jgi:hypothetical protein